MQNCSPAESIRPVDTDALAGLAIEAMRARERSAGKHVYVRTMRTPVHCAMATIAGGKMRCKTRIAGDSDELKKQITPSTCGARAVRTSTQEELNS